MSRGINIFRLNTEMCLDLLLGIWKYIYFVVIKK